MAQTVFRPNQIIKKEDEVMLKLTKEFAPPVEEIEEEIPEYTGPTADDLRREAEAFKIQWEAKKAEMLATAQNQADEIVKKAETAAFEQVKRQTDKAAILKTDAEKNAAEIVKKAQEEAQEIIAKANSEDEYIREKARKEGFEKGHEEGYQHGNEEANRLVLRLHSILEAVQNKRQDILDSTEQQIVELVILMTRKVVKIMSENQKSVVMANIVQALKKVKGRGEVTLRVNMEDVKLTSAHINDFIREVESVKNITVLEDSSVEKGGCIVETDFGAIDARVSSQLTELETKILEISPIRSVSKSDALNPDA